MLIRFVYIRSRNAAASGPTTSIFPSVMRRGHRRHPSSRDTRVRPPRPCPRRRAGRSGAASTGRRPRRRLRAPRARGGSASRGSGRGAAAVRPGDGRVRHRDGGRASAGRALRVGARVQEPVHDRRGERSARPTLVDRGADVRRTLHMFDRREADIERLRDVSDRLVALEVDERVRSIGRRRRTTRAPTREGPRRPHRPRPRATPALRPGGSTRGRRRTGRSHRSRARA